MMYAQELAKLYQRKEKKKIEILCEGIIKRQKELDKFFKKYL